MSPSRLENLTRFYEVPLLVTEELIRNLPHPDQYTFRLIDRVLVRGQREETRVYEVINHQPNAESKINLLPAFKSAWKLYQAGDFGSAATEFQTILDQNPNDKPTAILLQPCRHY